MMTDEQLQLTLQEVSDGIDKLSNLERALTAEEKSYRKKLLMRKYVLGRIKEAKEKNRRDDELYNSTVYELLVPWGERHPFLMQVMMHFMKIRWGSSFVPLAIRDSPKPKEAKNAGKGR